MKWLERAAVDKKPAACMCLATLRCPSDLPCPQAAAALSGADRGAGGGSRDEAALT